MTVTSISAFVTVFAVVCGISAETGTAGGVIDEVEEEEEIDDEEEAEEEEDDDTLYSAKTTHVHVATSRKRTKLRALK